MPQDNRISAEITAAVKTQILTKITEIFDLLTFLINLTTEERQSIPSIGTARAGMIEVFSQEMAAHPELVPSYVDTVDLPKDTKLYSDLRELAARAAELLEGLTDTAQVAGSDAYLAFLAFFNNVKEAARRGVVGADAFLARLQPFFARGPRTPTTT